MKKCERGFFLLEALLGMLILSIIFAAVFPVILQVQKERMTVREQREAMELLERGIVAEVFMSEKMPGTLEGKYGKYDVSAEDNGHFRLYCLNWEGRNLREQTLCSSADITLQ